MRACFLGQSVTALGFGVATLQTPPLVLDEETGKPLQEHADTPAQADDKRPAGHYDLAPLRARIRPL
jgi:hypothetical protein